YRERTEPGGILTRVASSHIRFGTFQYFAARADQDALERLMSYVIERHYPECATAEQPALALLEAIAQRTAHLIAAWQALGFIHGVMNTDNMLVCGETIDYGPCALMDTFRAVNELVFALLFIVAVGLGPFAGVLALFISTTGTLAKLFSEAVESIDPQPVEGIRATGANQVEEIIYGVVPQVLPLWISYTLYRFEANVRGASVLGIVGAGGIGQILWEIMRGFQYAETCALLIILVASVSIIDFISARIRAMLI
ncbi:MAG: phosphonate ABC transporter, permease protein PhnE, partial [Burkholderiaceae bacterium]